MGSYDFLLAGKPIDVPSPIALATSGLSLAELLTKTQMGQLGLQQAQQMQKLYSDPDYLRSLQTMMSGGAGAEGGGIDTSVLSRYPLAAPGAIKGLLEFQKNAADVASLRAGAAEKLQQVKDAQLKTLGNFADEAIATPTPDKYLAALRQLQHTGLALDTFGTPPNPMTSSVDDVTGWLKNVSGAVKTPEARANIIKTGTMLPLEAAASRAGTAKTQLETGLLPTEVGIKQQQANTAAAGAQTERWKFLGGNTIENAAGDRFQLAPSPSNPTKIIATPVVTGGASAAGTAGAAAPAPGAPGVPAPVGAPFQSGLGVGAKELVTADAKAASEFAAKIPAAIEGLNTIYGMRNLSARGQGIFSGPLRGGDFWKSVGGVLSQLPGASDAMIAKVSDTQAWEAQGGELAFNMLANLHGVAPRAQQSLEMIRRIKPNTIMTPAAQLDVFNALENIFQDQISYARAAAAAVQKNKPLSSVEIAPRGAAGFTQAPDGSWHFGAPQ